MSRSQLLFLFLLVLLNQLTAGVSLAETTVKPESDSGAQNDNVDVIDFNTHIRPILTSHCTSCHGGVKQAAGLSFVYSDTALDVIEPGEPDDSYLLDLVTEEDEDSRMPPPEHGPRLSDHDVDLLRRWIEQGAKWGKHWAYELPVRHPKPSVSNSAWGRQPLDDFVLAQLDDRGVKPASDERPERWLRRVTLDLIGLPPTLEQRSDFLDDLKRSGEQAYTTVVDRLLASKRFGERWASVWFDQVRYADSRGQGEDSPRDIWKYRDWVIDSLNNDMPYDQFTIKQLAGDLLPNATLEDRLATAVHRLTHTNEEGGTDDEEFRIEAVLDRVNTTWQTWQGTTFGCTQCHSHPYDPFEHDEYYKFAAFFNNTADCDLDNDWPLVPIPLDQNDYEKTTQLTWEIESLTRSLWQRIWGAASAEEIWHPLRIDHVTANGRVDMVKDEKPQWDEYHTEGTISNGIRIQAKMPIPKSVGQVTGIRITALPLDPDAAVADSEWGFVMSSIKAYLISPDGKSEQLPIAEVLCDEPFPNFDPNQSLNENSRDGFAAFTRIHHPRQAVLVLDRPFDAPEGSKVEVSLHHRWMELAAFPLLAKRGHFAVTDDPALIDLINDPALQSQQDELNALRQQREVIASIEIPVLQEREDHLARPTHVFIGGLFLTKDEKVSPDVPRSLLADEAPMTNRLTMAHWMVSQENPLTSRVAVNRLWARMFGVGLVATEEDFGSTGEPPSHPELLDDLAIRFREDYQWSVKKMLRELALSRTYRQSSTIRPELQEQDSNNRWLARGPRHNLPAETIRDQMLAVSGLLSTKMHGKPVQPPLPPGVWKARRGTWNTPKKGNEDRYRRSVYTYVKRSVPFPIHATFDAPSRDFCLPKRLRSNTPLQPLMLLNDAGFVECAQAFADRMQEQADEIRGQIEFGWLAATCRVATQREVDRLAELYDQIAQESGEEAALRSVARVLLNLDEIITK